MVLFELYSEAALPYAGWSNLTVATHVGLGHRLPPPLVRVCVHDTCRARLLTP